jgi:hypothetical protein
MTNVYIGFIGIFPSHRIPYSHGRFLSRPSQYMGIDASRSSNRCPKKGIPRDRGMFRQGLLHFYFKALSTALVEGRDFYRS